MVGGFFFFPAFPFSCLKPKHNWLRFAGMVYIVTPDPLYLLKASCSMNEDWEDVSIKLNIETTWKEHLPTAAFHAPVPRVVLLSVNEISDLLKYQIPGKKDCYTPVFVVGF